VLSSSPPESSHLIGSWLRERLGKPWIADLRDLWSHDHYRSFNALRRIPLKLREKGALKNADRIITVSNKWSEFLRKEYGDRVSAITNSFDEEQHNVVKRVGQDKFRITYLGKLNSKHQDITFFLEAVKELVEENKIAKGRFEANFYISGYDKPDIAGMANTRGLEGMVKEHKPIPFKNAIEEMKNSGLLLLVGWQGLSAGGWRPQKVYEYMGSGAPILLINSSENKELREVLLFTKSGSIADNLLSIKMEISRYYNNFIAKTPGEISQNKDVCEYSAFNVTKKLCGLIEEI